MSGVAVEQERAPELAPPEPTEAQNFWASVSALVVKESRWRMRGRRAFVIVTVYLAVLAFIVFAVKGGIEQSAAFGFDGGAMPPGFVSGNVSNVVGQSIFGLLLALQIALILLLAPALTSGAISMEREKQTLELLIATPFNALGLVIGKLVASLAYVFLLILASIPLMSLVFGFGGIAPDDVVRAYVMLFALAFGTGAIGLFMSALTKRTQIATALSYVIVFVLTIVTFMFHGYLLASSTRWDGRGVSQQEPPEAMLWLNPIVAGVDLICTAIPESSAATCAYILVVTGQDAAQLGGFGAAPMEIDAPPGMGVVDPPRDVFWPRSAAAFIVLGVALVLATTRLIDPRRRRRGGRRAYAPPLAGEEVAADGDAEDEASPGDEAARASGASLSGGA